MSGLGAFLRKELTEIVRTWRIWVIPGMLVFFGITSPIIAALTPALVHSMASSQPGVVIRIPQPTALDAYAQFLKNLDQFILIAIVHAYRLLAPFPVQIGPISVPQGASWVGLVVAGALGILGLRARP